MARVWVRTVMLAIAVTVMLVAIVGCSVASHHALRHGEASDAFCPPNPPSPGWQGGGGPAVRGLVPPGATSLVDCTYNTYLPDKGVKRAAPSPLRGVAVTGTMAVAAYAELLAEQPLASKRCAIEALQALRRGSEPTDFLLWTYQSGGRFALATAGRCSSVVGVGGAAVTPDGTAAVLLIGLTAAIADGPGVGKRPVPDLVGLSLAQAAARQRGLTVVQEMPDSHVAIGTVLLSGPPAGTPNPRGSGIEVVVAAHSVAACRVRDLQWSLSGGEPGAGTSFARLAVRDVGARPCQLRGPLEVQALDSAGGGLVGRTVGVSSGALRGLVLTPVGGTPPDATLAANILLSSSDYAGNCQVGFPPIAAIRVTLATRGRQSSNVDVAVRPGSVDGADFPPVQVCGFGAGPLTLPGLFEPG